MGACPRCEKDLPAPGLSFCPWCATSLSAPAVGQRKTVTILFGDLVDSTVLGSSVDPEVLRGVLADYWDGARTSVEKHGGTVEKFIGDAVVGIFGIPTVREDDALRAVRAAADLLAAVRDLNKDLSTRFGIELAVRLGVNTGEVLAGDGSGGMALMAGDAANVAARLEAAAAPGEVLLGESTFTLVRHGVEVEDVGPLVLKGKTEPVGAFRLLGVRSPTAAPTARRRIRGPLVGRRRPLQIAETAYATAVEERTCALLTVIGSPGVGKSRLIEELLSGVKSEAWVLQGRCLPYGEGITYWPITEVLTRLAEQDPLTLTARLAGTVHAEQVILGLDTLGGRTQASTMAEVAWAFRRLVEALALDRPVVLVLDDLQWAEAALLDLVDDLTDLARGAPVLVVCMARPEFLEERPGWGAGRRHAFSTELAPLSDADSRELVAGLLADGVGDELLAKVTSAAEGIPLFVEELVAMLVDQGILVADADGRWRAEGALDEVAVPATVHALLAARLDRLSPALRAVVDAASVLGKTFYPEALEALLGSGEDVSRDLEALERTDLIRRCESDLPGCEAFTFVHLLLRDTAYHGLAKSTRRELHQRCAGWLQSRPPHAVPLELIAFHHEQAAEYAAELGSPDQALAEEAARLLLTAGGRAVVRLDTAGARQLLSRAAALVPRVSPLGAEVSLARAILDELSGDPSAARAWAEDVVGIGQDLEDEALVWRGRLRVDHQRISSDPTVDLDAVLDRANRALEAYAGSAADGVLGEALATRALTHLMLGRVRQASSDSREGLRHLLRTGFPATWGTLAANALLNCHFGDGTLEEEERAVADIDELLGGDPALAPLLDSLRAWLRMDQGRVDEAARWAAEFIQLSLDQAAPFRGSGALSQLSYCQEWRHDLEGAAESLRTAAELCDQVDDRSFGSTCWARLAVVLAQRGSQEEARAALATSRAMSHPDDAVNRIFWAAGEGLLAAQSGDAELSERRFGEGLEVARRTEYVQSVVELWNACSLARESLGDLEGARDAARAALALCERKGMVPPLQLARARLVELGG